ncbi:MAG: non-canonical purine NTP pyrophosphatase [Actinomycetota bacterium]|nr:non-canonical purine NTP pyrophosphatase [Actinomycetota bacterium]
MDGLNARLASRNANKARELEHLLPNWRIEPLEADDYPAEDGATYYENARGKALFGRTHAEPEEWAMGEDSGIEVAALGGGPGVHSARSGGGDPVGWLLGQLSGVEDRRARYVSELVILSPAGEELRGTGTLEGRIAGEPRGTEGFGFDPVFVPDGEERTVAELGNGWKRKNSHRANAAQALLVALGETG